MGGGLEGMGASQPAGALGGGQREIVIGRPTQHNGPVEGAAGPGRPVPTGKNNAPALGTLIQSVQECGRGSWRNNVPPGCPGLVLTVSHEKTGKVGGVQRSTVLAPQC